MLGFLKRKPPVAEPLRGAPAIRREKTYAAQTGYVYQYYYEGYRNSRRGGRPGQEYVFQVSSDRKSSFPLAVFLPQTTVDRWQQGRLRTLSPTERYAAAKMKLFETFDECVGLGPPGADAEIDPPAMERLLAALGIE